MKIIITTLSILLLSGCVDARGKALQDQYCTDKGGVYEYLGGTGVVFEVMGLQQDCNLMETKETMKCGK